ADELVATARERKLKFTIGYSQRFNPKFAYVRKSIRDGSIGRPVSALVSRHITLNLGKKISGRIKLSPAAMEATHDLHFVRWGLGLPMSTMPGEAVEHTYAGPMAAETIHFLEAVAFDRPVLVTPEHARMVMEVYVAADLSAERNEPVALPLTEAKKVRAVA